MEALRAHKCLQKRKTNTLITTNVIVLSYIGISMFAGLWYPLLPIMSFCVVILATFLLSCSLLCIINSQLKTMGEMLPNKKRVVVQMVSTLFCLAQWLFLAYS